MLTKMWKHNVLGVSVERVHWAWTKKVDFVLFRLDIKVNPGFYPHPKVIYFLPVTISIATVNLSYSMPFLSSLFLIAKSQTLTLT